LTKRTIQYYWHLLRENLGLKGEPSFVPHILRHGFCSRTADRIGNAPAIMKLAGHSSLVVSQS
jgi:integrase